MSPAQFRLKVLFNQNNFHHYWLMIVSRLTNNRFEVLNKCLDHFRAFFIQFRNVFSSSRNFGIIVHVCFSISSISTVRN